MLYNHNRVVIKSKSSCSNSSKLKINNNEKRGEKKKGSNSFIELVTVIDRITTKNLLVPLLLQLI